MSCLGGGSPRGWALRRETGKGKGNSGVFKEDSSLFPAAGCCPGDRAGHLVESLGRVGVSSQEKAAAPATPPRRFWLWLEMLWTAVQPVVPWAQAGYRMGS